MNTCIQPAHGTNGALQFQFFYHMTHKDNLAGILQHGILSHADVLIRDDILATDISEASVQIRRNRQEPANHRMIHDYAPLYINPKNPMLSARRSIQHEIVLLKISVEVLQGGQHVFSDGNAASHDTHFSSDSNIVSGSIDVLNAKTWFDYEDGRRRRCAELLVYPNVQPVHILSIICSNNTLAKEIAMGTNLQIEVNPSMFF
jgi:hypothetical protein